MNIEPCMWCGEPLLLHVDDNMYTQPKPDYWVHCVNCGAMGPEKKVRKQAIKAWNEVARIVREAKETNYIKPSFAVKEISSYKGFLYNIIKNLDKDCYLLKVDDYLYDKEYETFDDAYEGLGEVVDFLMASEKEKDTE